MPPSPFPFPSPLKYPMRPTRTARAASERSRALLESETGTSTRPRPLRGQMKPSAAPEAEVRVFRDPCELRADRTEIGPPIVPSAYRGWDLDHRCRPLLPPDPGTPYGVMCGDCGRVTTRFDADGRKCCLGEFPRFPRCEACGEWITPVPGARRVHPDCEPGFEAYRRIGAEMVAAALPYCTCRNLDDRNCPHCVGFAQRVRGLRCST